MKMVIVMRTDLNMRKGKMVAQGAHAALTASMKMVSSPIKENREAFESWYTHGQKKICVSVESIEGLMHVKNAAFSAGINHTMITDLGSTEFKGVPTITCVAIGPDVEDRIDAITGGLKLL